MKIMDKHTKSQRPESKHGVARRRCQGRSRRDKVTRGVERRFPAASDPSPAPRSLPPWQASCSRSSSRRAIRSPSSATWSSTTSPPRAGLQDRDTYVYPILWHGRRQPSLMSMPPGNRASPVALSLSLPSLIAAPSGFHGSHVGTSTSAHLFSKYHIQKEKSHDQDSVSHCWTFIHARGWLRARGTGPQGPRLE